MNDLSMLVAVLGIMLWAALGLVEYGLATWKRIKS